jgi:hypothetical protein
MDQKSRRKELVAEYRRTGPEAGVYRLVNRQTGKMLLGSALNLGSMQGKLDFARKTGGISALDRKVWPDARQYGAEAFDLEILEVLEVRPEMTPAEVRADLTALEELWRERYDPALLY